MARNIEVTLELDNRQYNRAIKQSQTNTQGFVNTGVSGAGAIAAAFAAIGGTAVIGSIARVGSSFQDLQNSLNVVFGSIEEGNKQFERVKDFAAGTQFSVQQLTQAFVQLQGAGVEPTDELLKIFADTASVTTDQMGTFQAALDLVSRSTAGGLGLEDLNRLADRGIPVFQILSDKLGITRLEISEFGKTAEGAEKIIASLTEGLQERFGGALEDSAGNFSRATSNFNDAIQNLQGAIFDQFAEGATDSINGLTEAINSLATNTEGLSRFFGILGSVLEGIAAAFLLFGLGASDAAGKFVKFDDRLAKFTGRIPQIIKNFGTLALAFTAVGAAIKGLTAAGGIMALVRSLGALVIASGPVAAVIGGIAIAADLLFRVFNDGKGIIGTVSDAFADTTTEIDGMTGAMQRNAEAQAEFERRQQEAIDAAAAVQAAFNEEFGETIELAKQFRTNDYRTELEKLTDRVQIAKDTLYQLRMAFVAANGDIENYSALIQATKDELEAAEAALQKYNDGLKDPAPQSYKEFLVELLESTRDYSNQQENARKALEFLNTEMVKGALTTEEYNYALERLNSILGITEEKVPTEAFDAFNDLLEDIAKNTENYNLMIERLNQLYTEGALTAEQYAEAKRNLDEAFTENEGVDNFLETLGRAQVALSTDLADAFLNGKSALDSFKNFFKKIVSQIIADIIRLQIIQPILGSLLAPFGFGFGTGGSVIRLPGKAMGGPVSKDNAYLVGERGPEVFVPNSSGSIIPNNRLGTQVTYNINAVDALSFKQMVARDPEFIYSVTQRGARSLPA